MKFLSLLVFLLVVANLYTQIAVQGESTKIFDVAIGESGSGVIELYNQSQIPINIKITQVDYLYNSNKEVFYLEAGKYERSNASWLRYAPSMSIMPNQTIRYPFSFVVPRVSTLNGSYWSVLLVEQDYFFSMESVQDVVFTTRFAIQIVHNIKNTGNVNLSFLETVFEESGAIIFVRNTGTRWFEASLKLDIYDTSAQLVRSQQARNSIYPGLERQFEITFNPLPPGEYYAVIILDCGNNQIFGHQANFRIR